MAGDVINKVPVLHIDELERFCKENRVEIAILTIPSKYAQTMAAKLTELGIKGLWNFTNVELKVCEDVIVEDVHFSDSMMTLCYRISEE